MKPNLFRKIITRFGQLPMIGLVILLIMGIAAYTSFQNQQIMQATMQEQVIATPSPTADDYIGYADIDHGFLVFAIDQVRLWFHLAYINHTNVYRINMAILVCASIFLSFLLGSIIKYYYYKPRPQPQPYKNRWQKIDASSFPSIHTANSLILAFWGLIVSGGLVIQGFSPAGKLFVQYGLPLFWFLFYVLISYSRVVLKKHFWIDLLGGTIFGIVILLLVNWHADNIIHLVWKIGTIIFR